MYQKNPAPSVVTTILISYFTREIINLRYYILHAEKFLKCDCLKPVVFEPISKYFHIKITVSFMVTEILLFLCSAANNARPLLNECACLSHARARERTWEWVANSIGKSKRQNGGRFKIRGVCLQFAGISGNKTAKIAPV